MAGIALLEVGELAVSYGKVQALHGASLRVRAGQIVAVIGSNGAGKTTLLAAIMGLLPSQGEITFLGRRQTRPEPESRVALGMTLVPETRALFGEMSVADNLLMGAFQRHRQGHRDHGQTMAEVFRVFPRLAQRATQFAATLSGGERQMLAMGRAMMAKPRLLMLDEPSLGLAPLVVREIFHVITTLRERGVGILLVEQNARAALQLADYGYVMETGQIILDGPGRALAGDARVIDSYLGLARPAAAP